MNLEGLIIKYSIGSVFVGVTAIFAGKILFLVGDYFVHGNGLSLLAHWIWEVTKEAGINLGESIKDAVWKSIFGG